MLRAITRLPGSALADGELTYKAREPVDVERALEQHAGYRAALAELGYEVELLPALDGHPDATFVEDVALVLDEVAVMLRPGVESRHGEVAALEPALARHRELERIEAPCTLEGGDALAGGDMLYVGQSRRTNHAGLKQLAHTLLGHGYRVKAVTVEGCLHLKTGCTLIDQETLLANPDWIDLARFKGFELVPVDPREPFGANTITAGRTVLASSAFPRTAERVSARGFDVRLVDLSEFHKLEAGLTCLSLLFETA